MKLASAVDDRPALPNELEEWWDDYRRSLKRRGRSDATADSYRRSYERFWRWAHLNGTDTDPAAVDYRIINSWTDGLAEPVSPATIAILWRNLRPLFAWWAKESDQPNPFARADVPGGRADRRPRNRWPRPVGGCWLWK